MSTFLFSIDTIDNDSTIFHDSIISVIFLCKYRHYCSTPLTFYKNVTMTEYINMNN